VLADQRMDLGFAALLEIEPRDVTRRASADGDNLRARDVSDNAPMRMCKGVSLASKGVVGC